MERMKKKLRRCVQEFLLFFQRCVSTCSYLSSLPQRERERTKKGREEGRKKKRGEKEEGRLAVSIKAKPVTPAFQWRRWRMEEAGFTVFPPVRWNLWIRSGSDLVFGDFLAWWKLCEKVMECANRALFAHKQIRLYGSQWGSWVVAPAGYSSTEDK